jgi:hypothetical protein
MTVGIHCSLQFFLEQNFFKLWSGVWIILNGMAPEDIPIYLGLFDVLLILNYTQ